MINSVFKEFPTIKYKTICSSSQSISFLKLKIYLLYQTVNGKISNLQQFLDSCLQSERSTCKYMVSEISYEGTRKVITAIYDTHLFIGKVNIFTKYKQTLFFYKLNNYFILNYKTN